MLELTKCIWRLDADLPEVLPEEQAAYERSVEKAYTPEWFIGATLGNTVWLKPQACSRVLVIQPRIISEGRWTSRSNKTRLKSSQQSLTPTPPYLDS